MTERPDPEAMETEGDLRRLASNNPAMSMPPTQTLTRGSTFDRRVSRPLTTTMTASASDLAANPAAEDLSDESTQQEEYHPSKYEVGWRRVVRNFSPSWFSVTMGTGVVSIILIAIPFKADWLYWLSVIFFGLNTILFSIAFTISVLRYTLYPEIWRVMIQDANNSLFLGCIPIGFATLVESWIFLCCPYWGYWSVTFAWALWILDSLVACAITVSLPFLLMSQVHQQTLDRITAAQLLPIAATIVASGLGSETAELLHEQNPQRALGTLIASYVMWGMATPFAMTIIVIYYQRLALHKLPPREVVVSSFLPLGPLGMGGFAIVYCGRVARVLFPKTNFFQGLPIAGDIVWVAGIFVALIMWGFGLCWLVFALATIYNSRPFPFNMGWWGFTFPLGVYALSTMQFGVEMPSLFFRVLGTIFGVTVILLWGVCAAGTAKGAWKGHLFYAPCLKNLKKDEDTAPSRNRGDTEKTADGRG